VFSGLAPQLGPLLVGALPISLAALERAADAFLAGLDNLTEVVTASEAPRLFPWLGAAALAAGAYEFARRRVGPSGRGGRGGPTWAPFPVLAVLPSEE
jgi:hypothetical protein